jgi:RHS repeat-associated protein
VHTNFVKVPLASYRFGFNGQEKDNELSNSNGTNYSFQFRLYDSRLARFLKMDPLYRDYPWNSTYAFAENDVLRSIDIEGLEKYTVTGNTITIQMKIAAFSSRPEGGNIPNGLDVISLSRANWAALNLNQQNKDYFLAFAKDKFGNVSTSPGNTPYNVQFEVQVEVFENENTEGYKNLQSDPAFTGVYLFGATNFNGADLEEKGGAQTYYEVLGNGKEAVVFNTGLQPYEYFSADAETHEGGHTLGLGHWRLNTGGGYMDQIGEFGRKTFDVGGVYNSSGIMKYNGAPGSSTLFSTQLKNILTSIPGEIIEENNE